MTNKSIFYSGIGSRKTPPKTLQYMTQMAKVFEEQGYVLRSGGAEGADRAFENGCTHDTHKRIYRPHHATRAAEAIAEKYHPNWKACQPYVRKLHARNVLILLGDSLKSPSEFCMCWTPDGKIIGGTGMSIRIADGYGIKVINLGDK